MERQKKKKKTVVGMRDRKVLLPLHSWPCSLRKRAAQFLALGQLNDAC
jgi:hypothetical protein